MTISIINVYAQSDNTTHTDKSPVPIIQAPQQQPIANHLGYRNINTIQPFRVIGNNSVTYCSQETHLLLSKLVTKNSTPIAKGNAISIWHRSKNPILTGDITHEVIEYASKHDSTVIDMASYITNTGRNISNAHRFAILGGDDGNWYVVDGTRISIGVALLSEYITKYLKPNEQLKIISGYKTSPTWITQHIASLSSPTQLLDYTRPSGQLSAVEIIQDIKYLSEDNTIQALIHSGIQITTADETPIHIKQFGLTPHTAGPSTFQFGISGQHLIFSQPIQLRYTSDQPDGTIIQIGVKHGDQQEFGSGGLSVNNQTQCLPDGSATIPGTITTVQSGVVEFWTCGASTFIIDPLLPDQGINGSVNTVLVQPDGKIIIGGSFTLISGMTYNRIARLNIDGTVDTTFLVGVAFNSTVNTLALQSDGKVIVGGIFTSYSGVTQNRITRLNSNGTRDTGFNIGGGFNSDVNALALQSDGHIIIGGNFTNYSGINLNRIIRLTSTGLRDTNFIIGGGYNGVVRAIVIQSDGNSIIGGDFTSYSGIVINRISRLTSTGLIDTSFVVGSAFNNTVRTISLQPDGKVIIGGIFTSYSGGAINRIIRLNTTGSRDSSFVVGSAFNGDVNTLALQLDGKVVVGGGFTNYGGITQNRITRLETNGSRDTGFVIGGGFDNTVSNIILQADGKIVIGGVFSTYNTTAVQHNITRLTTTGFVDISLLIKGGGLNNIVNTIIKQNDGKLIVGGVFTFHSGTIANRIIRLLPDGLTRDTSFLSGTAFNNTVNTLLLQPDSRIIVGGVFTSYEGIGQNRITRLNTNGTRDTGFNIGGGFNSDVNALALQSDGHIIIGGNFTNYSGINLNRIIRVTSTGLRDTSFNIGLGFNNRVRSIIIQPDNKVIVGGDFTSYNGTNVNRIVRLTITGSIDTSFIIGSAFNNGVNTILLQPDGKLIVGGVFGSYNGTAQNRITRLTDTGARDTSFNIGSAFNSSVNTLSLQSDNKIIVGGQFTTYNGIIQNRITRLTTTGARDTSFIISGGFDNTVNTVLFESNGKILVGGLFNSYTTITNKFLTRIISINEIVGTVSISSSGTTNTGITASNTQQIVTTTNTNLILTDNKGSDSGYYTTISMTNLTSSGGSIIPTTQIKRKAGGLTLLAGSPNTGVNLLVSTGSYTSAALPVTFMQRSAGSNSGLFSTYSSTLTLQITVPAYTSPGMYTGIITYTLYEN